MADHEQAGTCAHATVLDGQRDGVKLGAIEAQVGRTRMRGWSPDVAMFELIIAALDVADVSRDRRLEVAGWRGGTCLS